MKRAHLSIAAFLLGVLSLTTGQAQTLQLQVDSNEIHVGIPFVLSLAARGFDEEPQPDPPQLAVDNATVTYVGVSPNVSSRIQIINGRRSEWRDVTYVYRWRVEPKVTGSYRIPPLTVTQGAKSATTQPASFSASEIESNPGMQVRMQLPDRTVWVGETFEVAVEWLFSERLLRRDVGEHQFVVPLFDMNDVLVEAPPMGPRDRALAFPSGAGEINLPMRQDTVNEGGQRFTRLSFPARITVNRPGPLEIDPVVVAASLETGTRRDSFGFRVPAYQLYKAEGEQQRLVVRQLPLEGRPATFSNAIGSGFAIDVQASRTVVQVGDPVELTVTVRGDGPLEGLSLPALDGSGGLSPDLFSVLDAGQVGEIDAEANAKTFEVTVRVRSAEAREIPALEFAYFDPSRGEYGVATSQPIALSVAGSNLVGAEDVAAAPSVQSPVTTQTQANAPQTASSNAFASLIGADMSLSAAGSTQTVAWTAGRSQSLIATLYLIPILILVWRLWSQRTAAARSRGREIRQARAAVDKALRSSAPARESAPRVVNALRTLAMLTGRGDDLRNPIVERLETSGFDPTAADRTLDSSAAEQVRQLADQWVRDAAANGDAASATTVVAVLTLTLMALFSVPEVDAQAPPAGELDAARTAYQAALQEQDRVRRTRLFGDAEQQFARIAQALPAAPDVQADWGNAALGAQRNGAAVLAFRRALAADPDHERAQRNLGWVRDRLPTWVPRPAARSALDSLFFWHHSLTVGQRHLIGAASFAVALLLLAPWGQRRTVVLRRLAVPALLVWVAMSGSALLDGDQRDAAVIMNDGVVLRSADSLGAPPSLANPLPAGVELRVLEQREAWSRVELADGTRGWLAASAIARVASAPGRI